MRLNSGMSDEDRLRAMTHQAQTLAQRSAGPAGEVFQLEKQTIESDGRLAYLDGVGTSIGDRTLGDGSKVEVFSNGVRVTVPDGSASRFEAGDTTPFGMMMTSNELSFASSRASTLTWKYDEPGTMHDIKAWADNLVGITPKPVLTPDQQTELKALQDMTRLAREYHSNPEQYNIDAMQLQAAANGPFGALTAMMTSRSDVRTRYHATQAAIAVDNGLQSVAMAAAAKAELPQTRFAGMQGRIGVGNSESSPRPSWRQSELDVGVRLEGQGFKPQISFKNGIEVPYGTKGSSRPEFFGNGVSVEVKNYNVETVEGRANLERNVVGQAVQRIDNLPTGTVQILNLDIRGQNISRAEINKMMINIEQKSGGAITRDNINVIR
jgi:hypothetical protein